MVKFQDATALICRSNLSFLSWKSRKRKSCLLIYLSKLDYRILNIRLLSGAPREYQSSTLVDASQSSEVGYYIKKKFLLAEIGFHF